MTNINERLSNRLDFVLNLTNNPFTFEMAELKPQEGDTKLILALKERAKKMRQTDQSTQTDLTIEQLDEMEKRVKTLSEKLTSGNVGIDWETDWGQSILFRLGVIERSFDNMEDDKRHNETRGKELKERVEVLEKQLEQEIKTGGINKENLEMKLKELEEISKRKETEYQEKLRIKEERWNEIKNGLKEEISKITEKNQGDKKELEDCFRNLAVLENTHNDKIEELRIEREDKATIEKEAKEIKEKLGVVEQTFKEYKKDNDLSKIINLKNLLGATNSKMTAQSYLLFILNYYRNSPYFVFHNYLGYGMKKGYPNEEPSGGGFDFGKGKDRLTMEQWEIIRKGVINPSAVISIDIPMVGNGDKSVYIGNFPNGSIDLCSRFYIVDLLVWNRVGKSGLSEWEKIREKYEKGGKMKICSFKVEHKGNNSAYEGSEPKEAELEQRPNFVFNSTNFNIFSSLENKNIKIDGNKFDAEIKVWDSKTRSYPLKIKEHYEIEEKIHNLKTTPNDYLVSPLGGKGGGYGRNYTEYSIFRVKVETLPNEETEK